jgi:protein-tyrosine phosphatase
MIIKPIPNSYRVIPGKFLAGEYPRNFDEESSKKKIKALVDAGVSVFIDLTTKEDRLKPYDYLLKPYKPAIQHLNFPIPDLSIPSLENQTIDILDTIEKCIEAGRMVYLHCWGGVGRTGLIVGCWLAEHGYPGQSAIIKLQELWSECSKSATRNSPETKTQEDYVIKWTKNKQKI